MKKFIVVIMALITIFSASVTAFASSQIALNVLGEIVNAEFNSRVCTLREAPSSKPYFSPNMYDSNGNLATQKTTYDSLFSLYDYLTINGISFTSNIISPAVVEWYKATDLLTGSQYYVILVHVDESALQNAGKTGFVSNYAGKILYCDAPVEGDGYSVVAIAGVSNYYLTNRPAGTTGNGYLGDLYLSYNNWLNIQSTLNNLTGDKSYYTYGHSINGEFRYYLANRPSTITYYVCNSAGQLFYTIKDTGSSEDTGGGGSTFDPTEVITAINSVYDAINSQGSRLANGLSQLTITANTISDILNLHMNNVVDGFGDIQNSLSTLNSYFTDLSGLFPVQETITLLGSDTRVAWDSADRITNVTAAGFNGDLIVKERPGDLVDESGYEKVTINETEYSLYNDNNGYRRIKAANEYPDLGTPIPDGTLFYFPFDQSLSSSVGNFSFGFTTDSSGSASYSLGVNGDAFIFNGTQVLISPDYGNFVNFTNGSFTMSYWLYLTNYGGSKYVPYVFQFGSDNRLVCNIFNDGTISYSFYCNGQSGSLYGSHTFPLNQWVNIAMTYSNSTFFGFINGELDASGTFSGFSGLKGTLQLAGGNFLAKGTMLDELIMINGRALWTSSFDAEKEAVFAEVAKDYFLSCTNQNIGLVFDDTINKTLSPTDVNGNAITMGRLEDDFSEIYMDISTMMWYCHDPQTQTEILLSSANQEIMNDTIYVRQNYTILPADQITADVLQNLLPVDSPVYLDMPEGAKLTITYDHYTGWFRMMYILMDKQTKLLSDLDIVNETIINVENTVIDITNSNPAYNVFYITKTDGTTESVGDAAKDAAVFVGDILSMFYRLVFDDALDNVGILKDFEGAYSNTEVSVW